MAKAVTLKNNNNEEIYPVTSVDLITGTIPTSQVRDGAITTSKITNLAVTGAKIANGTITKDKIDYSTMGPVWSGFYFTCPIESQSVVVTTKKGTQLTLSIGNGGTAIRVVSGGGSINMYRQYWSAWFSSGLTDNYGVHGCASGTSINNRYYGYVNNGSGGGAGVNIQTATTGTGGECYGNLASMGASKTSTEMCYTALRAGNGNVWVLRGTASSSGTNTGLDFDVLVTSATGYIPTAYQRGANATNVVSGYNYIEFLEV